MKNSNTQKHCQHTYQFTSLVFIMHEIYKFVKFEFLQIRKKYVTSFSN